MNNRVFVATLRSILLGAAAFVVTEIIAALSKLELEGNEPVMVPLVLIGLRIAEGAIDQLRKGNEDRNALGL